MGSYYVLRNGEPVPEPDVIAWARWFEGALEERRVVLTELPGGVEVSTVFLSLDHGYGDVPILWETMAFTDDIAHPWHDYQERYTSRQDAEAGHKRVVGMIEAGQLLSDEETR